MKKNWIMIVLVVGVILGALYFVIQSRSGSNIPASGMPVPGSDVPDVEVNSGMPVPGIDVSEMILESERIPNKAGSYEGYHGEKIALAETGKVVLFFHAPWCPSCRALHSDIEKNINTIPAGVTILKTDYDTETELKKKYGVTYQHTMVQVDKNGNLIKKWSGGLQLEKLLSQIQ